jgi:hypothetical protein
LPPIQLCIVRLVIGIASTLSVNYSALVTEPSKNISCLR